MSLISKFRMFTLAFVAVACYGCAVDSSSSQYVTSVHEPVEQGRVFAEVLIPAGTTGNEDLDFLPYPGNWSSVVMPAKPDARVIVLSQALTEGSVLAIEPVAVLQLDSAGTQIDVIVAVPTDTSLQSVQLGGFVDLITDREPIRHILQTWFVNHRGFGAFEVLGWRDEEYAADMLK